jgi:hypothetical protein
MRNLRGSKRLWGRSSVSRASVEVVNYDRKGKYVKESTDGDWGLHSEFGEKCRSELLRDDLVSVGPRVCTLYVGVVLVDGEVIRRNSRQSDISPKVR